ncbi:hypothetical protein EPUL_002460 [Erysiphe pulchra]|uniref:Uncharacterized protein n=1 Tax=Erysiphe pulchra TaxID=225359 RepID=A0A2S4PXI3_9PEZI|nr:hypothetical protein EPUL_002460 [Erysiphe pulchra]
MDTMDIVQDTQARPVDTSPPNLIIPQTILSPSPTAPPPPLQTQSRLNDPVTNRRILELVLPSKRAAPDAGEEREMAKSVQAYLRNAISKFAISDEIPSVPKILPETNTILAPGNSKINIPKKPSMLATPVIALQEKLVHTPETLVLNSTTGNLRNESSWSTVVRNGHKKSRATLPTTIQTLPTEQPKKPAAQQAFKLAQNTNKNRKQPKKSSQDKSLFIRLPENHELRKLSPAGIPEIVVKNLSFSPTSICLIKPVRTGFALSPCSNKAYDELLKAAVRLYSFDAKLEPASNWLPVIIPNVPKCIVTLAGENEVTKEMLFDEVERVTSLRPASLRPYGRNAPEAPHRTWMAFFTKAPRPVFRVFYESGFMRTLKKQQPLDFCKRLNGHHSP